MSTYKSLVTAAKATLKDELRAIRERAAAGRRAIGKRAATAGPDLVAEEREQQEARRIYNDACKDAAHADPDGFAAHQLATFGHDPRAPMTVADMAGCD